MDRLKENIIKRLIELEEGDLDTAEFPINYSDEWYHITRRTVIRELRKVSGIRE